MSNLTAYPLVDAFETLLAQSWDWNVGWVYLNAVPAITFPSGVTTYIGVDMENTLRQVGRINEVDSVNNRVYVSSIAVNRSPGVAYTAQSHGVHAKVIIGDNYQFWEDIANTFLTKANTNDSTMFVGYYATLAARDAAIPSPVSGKYSAFTLEEWVWRDYDSSGWSTRQGGTTVNATESVAWKLQASTLAHMIAGTRTWISWALNAGTPDYIASVVQWGNRIYCGTNATWNDSYAPTITPAITAYTTGMRVAFRTDVANTGACTLALSGLTAKSIKTPDGLDPVTGSIKAGAIISVQYDGTNRVLMGGAIVPVGNGSDWAIWAGALTITWSNNTYITKQYTTFAPGANTVTITPTNCILHIKVQWDCDLTWTTFSFAGKWGQWGAAGSGWWWATVNGSPGDDWLATCGLVNGWGGWGMAATKRLLAFIDQNVGFIQAGCWWGWGWGQYDSDLTGSATAGAAGWWCLILEVWGNLTFSGTTMNFNGSNASSVWSGAQGAGWGGWWGCIVILYRGTLSGSPTTNVAGGTWGTGWGTYAGGDGGNSIVTTGTDTTNSNGGAGAAGIYYIAQVI